MRVGGYWLLVSLVLLSFQVFAKGPRKVAVKIDQNLELGGISFRGPDYEFYEDWQQKGLSAIAKGTLDSAQEVAGLWLPAGTVVNLDEGQSQASTTFADKVVIAGVTLKPNQEVSFGSYPIPEPGATFGTVGGTVIYGSVGEDSELDIYGFPAGEKPVRERIELRKGDGINFWCVEKPCRETSRVSVISSWTLSSQRFIDRFALEAGDIVFIDPKGRLSAFKVKDARQIDDYKVIGDVQLYPDGKLKNFNTLNERIQGLEINLNDSYGVFLHKNGSVAQIETSFRDQSLGDLPIQGWSALTFWSADDPNFLGSVKMVTVGRDARIPGVRMEFERDSRLFFDKNRKLREALVTIRKGGQTKPQSRRLIFDEKGEVTDEKDFEQGPPAVGGQQYAPNIPGWNEDAE